MIEQLVIASRNPHKIQEMKEILTGKNIEVLSTADFPELEEVVEDQPTLEGNALKKARYVHQVTGLPALSDDTGLEVDALDGAPGVYSARYAGEDACYQDNVNKLLKELKSETDRKARFRTVVALVTKEGEWLFHGVCKGAITNKERGEKGFGYDPVFMPEGFEQTFAELSANTKNEISHRGRAVQQFLGFLTDSN